MIGEIDDGALRQLAFDFYQGLAGVRTVGIETHAAYHGQAPDRAAIGSTGTVGDQRYRVVRAGPSARNRGMVLLVIEAVED